MLWTLLTLGSIPFYVFSFIVFWLIVALVENDHEIWAFVSLGVSFFLLAELGNINIIKLTVEDPKRAVILLGLYFAVGIVWSVVKWWFYLHKQLVEYNEMRANFLEMRKLPPGSKIPDDMKEYFKSYLDNHGSSNSNYFRSASSVSRNKVRITAWMAYWPFSMTWTLLSDPVMRLWKNIFNLLQSIYEKIAAHVFRGVTEDLKPPRKADIP